MRQLGRTKGVGGQQGDELLWKYLGDLDGLLPLPPVIMCEAKEHWELSLGGKKPAWRHLVSILMLRYPEDVGEGPEEAARVVKDGGRRKEGHHLWTGYTGGPQDGVGKPGHRNTYSVHSGKILAGLAIWCHTGHQARSAIIRHLVPDRLHFPDVLLALKDAGVGFNATHVNLGSPRRRRIPVRNHDENVPGTRTLAEPSARSLSQRRRHQLEIENRPQPPQTPPPTNKSQAQAACRCAEKEAQSAQMDVDARDYRSEQAGAHGPSRILQALANGILTPPPTQQLAVTRNNGLIIDFCIPSLALTLGPDQIPPPNRDNSAVNHAPLITGGRRVRQAVTRQLLMVACREYCDPESRHDFGPMEDVCPSCKALHWEEEKVVTPPKNARSPYGICCNHGKVALNKLKAPPEPLHRLFLGRDTQVQEFREHIT
ncbi:hypothetical protein DFH08DRAFT_1024576 [Mycena albidolilacea]|uniref:Uncharacterized protein n=1 Tax=Mycena albidolilacea TaxID=1033008 RepID=A0AAD7ALI0_9AGAR|nr:hypothetical protein DFH08DRAFT_1024576 [Mycena albidolilacea]